MSQLLSDLKGKVDHRLIAAIEQLEAISNGKHGYLLQSEAYELLRFVEKMKRHV